MSVANLLRPNNYDLYANSLNLSYLGPSDSYLAGTAYVKKIAAAPIECAYVLQKIGNVVFLSLDFVAARKTVAESDFTIEGTIAGVNIGFITPPFLPPTTPGNLDRTILIPCQVVGAAFSAAGPPTGTAGYSGTIIITIPANPVVPVTVPPTPQTPQEPAYIQVNIFGVGAAELSNFNVQADGAGNLTGLSRIGVATSAEYHTYSYSIA